MILSKFKINDKIKTIYSENVGVVIEKQYFDYLDMHIYLVELKGSKRIFRENELEKV